MVVVTFPMEGDPGKRLPVVPGAEFVAKEDRGHFHAYYAPTSERWIKLYRVAPGRFLVTEVHGQGLQQHIPTGITWRAFVRSPAGRKLRWWRCSGTDVDGAFAGRLIRLGTDRPAGRATVESPWVVDGVTIERARPALPSRCGQTRAEAAAFEIEDTDDD